MGKRLAIGGNSTRGSEVIEILEMMGGKNIRKEDGAANMYSYYLCNNIILSDRLSILEDDDFVIFTIEEFLKKYPYKIGDKAVYIDDNDIVVISEIEWDDTVGDIFYNVKRIDEDDCFLCPPEVLKPYKEEVNMNENKFGTAKNPLKSKSNAMKLVDGKCEMTHEDAIFDSAIWHLRNSVNNGKQNISGGECERYFRELVEKLKGTITPTPDITAEVTDKNNCDIGCPDGYEFYDESGNLIGTKVMMRPKKPKYPKTYVECCQHLGCDDKLSVGELIPFQQLVNARNAYWKIAGEEMGLDKPWKPDWCNEDKLKYCIEFSYGTIDKTVKFVWSCVLSFPTEEMRDTFYENFKDLIIRCKELL